MIAKLNACRIIGLMLLLHHGYAACAWKEIASDQVATEFINAETARRFGILVQMWNMSDYKVPQEVGNGRLFKSSKTLQEYNCETRQKRFLTMIHYVENTGLGQVAFLDGTVGGWRDIKPGSLGEMHLNVACSTK